MKYFTPLTLVAALGFSVFGCQTTNELESVEIQDFALETELDFSGPTTKDNKDYYQVRRDMRKCAAPACGGYFLSRLNRWKTPCLDGSLEDECYVPQVSLPAGVNIENGDIVHGWYGAGVGIFEGGILEADFAYHGVLETSDFGTFNLLYSTGIMCITTPCPSSALAHLNTNWLWTSPNYQIQDQDLELSTAFDAEYANDVGAPGGGAITFGNFYWSWEENSFQYSVSNVFTEIKASIPACVTLDQTNHTTAWSFSNHADAKTFALGLDNNDNIEGQVLIHNGYCGEQQIFCPEIFQPVHGTIDALGNDCQMEGNACFFRAAIIRSAGQSKAQGTWSAGSCDEG